MEAKLCIYTCNSLVPEISHLLLSENYPDVTIKSFPAICVGSWLSNEKITEMVANDIDQFSKIIIIVSACRGKRNTPPPDNKKIEIIQLEQCFEILLNPPTIYHYFKQGYYAVSNGWLRNYNRHIREWGFDQESARKFFGETIKKILLLDTGLPGDYKTNIEALSEYMGLPYDTLPVGTNHLQQFLDTLILKWRRDIDFEKQNERIAKLTNKSADYELVFGQLKNLIDLTDEHLIVKEISLLLDILFAPDQLCYQQYHNGIEREKEFFKGANLQIEFSPDNSFKIDIKHHNELVASFEIIKVKFPQHIPQYQTLVQVINQIGGLSIANARKYSQLEEAKINLSLSEERFRLFAQSAPVGIAIFEKDGEAVFVSNQFVEIFGYSTNNFTNVAQWWLVAYPDKQYREHVQLEWNSAMEQILMGNNNIRPMEFIVNCYDGNKKQIEFRIAKAGELNFVICTDISDRKKAEHNANERLKELNAFYKLAELAEKKEISPDELFSEFIEKFPLSWQYPDITYARICWGKKEFKTTNYIPSGQWVIESPIIIDEKHSGLIEVGYLEERPHEYEGPFMKEERMLIDGIAERLGQITKRRDMEEELLQRERLFKAIMLQSPSVIELYDLKGLQINANKAYEELWGFPASHTINRYNILKSEEVIKTGLIDYVMRAYNGELVQVPEYRFDSTGETEGKGKGRVRWLSTRIYPIKDNNNKVINIIVTHEDVTTKKQADNVLTENVQKFKNLSRSGTEMLALSSVQSISDYITQKLNEQYPDAIILFSTIDKTESLSTLKSIVGVSEKRIKQSIKYTGFDFFKKQFDLLPLHRQLFKSGNLNYFENGLSEFSGHEFPKLAAKAIEKLFRIKQIYTIGINKDEKLYATIHLFNRGAKPITDNEYIESFVKQAGIVIERKLLENLLAESEERYRLIAENTSDVIWSIDINTLRFNYISPSVINLTGFTVEEAMSKTIQETLEEKSANFVLAELPKRIEDFYAGNLNKRIDIREMQQWCKDGSLIWVEYTTMFLSNNEGHITGILGVTRNINERKTAEIEIQEKNRQLHEANATKDKFFSIISHDLRSPFASLVGFTELMADEQSQFTIEEYLQYSKSLNKTAQSTFNLLENLLEWSRLQREAIHFNPQIIDMKKFFNDFDDSIIDMAKKKSITLEIVEPKNIQIKADRDMLKSILRNLVVNALKFTNEGGKVSVEVKKNKQGEAQFSVSDTGIGMDQKRTGMLFRLDTKVSRPGTNGESSSGLGLILCKEFVEKHGGKIWTESEEGKGSTFFFTLSSI
jgi:PAS domain S-box-containing protein